MAERLTRKTVTQAAAAAAPRMSIESDGNPTGEVRP
jgi:hypothetical protein